MATSTLNIDRDIMGILSNCEIEGAHVRLPGVQLDRSTYVKVNKVLELMGSKWNKSSKTHVFPEPPIDLMDTVLLTGEIVDKKKLFQFYETPRSVAQRMIELAELKPNSDVLEPSAGRGAICRVLRETPFRSLTMFELSPEHYSVLCGHELGSAFLGDFLAESCKPTKFDAIVMNPPFTRRQDIAHIKHAIGMLAEGGRLVAICSAGPRQQDELEPLSDYWQELPAGTFSESGTDVRTILLRIRA